MFHLHHVPENFPAVIKMTVNQNCNIKKKKNWHISVAITAINCLIRSLPRQRTISSQANQNHCCSKEHGGQGLHPLIQVHHWHPGHSDTTGFGFHKNKVFFSSPKSSHAVSPFFTEVFSTESDQTFLFK